MQHPHRGILTHRIPVEGAGGLIYVLLPVLILAWVAPWLLLVLAAAGGLTALLLHRRGPCALTAQGGVAPGLLAIAALLYLAGAGTFLQPAVALCCGGGLLVACALHGRQPQPAALSIRRH